MLHTLLCRGEFHTRTPGEPLSIPQTAADILVETIHDWGVRVVFGMPGDGINGIMEALRKRADDIRFVQVRHEEAAAFMATGYTIEDPAQCGDILDTALADPGPVIVDALVDPHEPPMPPKVSLEQAAKFAESLARGTSNREKIALTVMRDKERELI